VKAYDILSQLQSEMPSAQPPTVYRALDFLMENGFIHKLQSMNAYIGCHHPSPDTENCYFLICSHCDETLEMQLPHTEQRLIKNIEKHQFQVQHITVEIAGLCKTCQTAA
jgi:Fur family zinc uptake transcriptional regulator